jgi:hypothetical protein
MRARAQHVWQDNMGMYINPGHTDGEYEAKEMEIKGCKLEDMRQARGARSKNIHMLLKERGTTPTGINCECLYSDVEVLVHDLCQLGLGSGFASLGWPGSSSDGRSPLQRRSHVDCTKKECRAISAELCPNVKSKMLQVAPNVRSRSWPTVRPKMGEGMNHDHRHPSSTEQMSLRMPGPIRFATQQWQYHGGQRNQTSEASPLPCTSNAPDY